MKSIMLRLAISGKGEGSVWGLCEWQCRFSTIEEPEELTFESLLALLLELLKGFVIFRGEGCDELVEG